MIFLSADWGTTLFRLRLIDSTTVVAKHTAGSGISATYAQWQRSELPETERIGFYRAIIEHAIGEWRIDLHGVPLVVSGMASSSIGMLELPYKPLPFDVTGADLRPTVLPPTKDSPRTVYLLPGVRSADDVMRGEETQLVGALAASPGDGVFLFPGTHSKHILVRDGQAVAFKTYMTGEIFGLLAGKSILAASVTAPGQTAAPGEPFFAGVAAAARGAGLLHNAFLTRTNQLFNKYTKKDNYHFLSGLLIGEELRELASGESDPADPTVAWRTMPPAITLVATSPLRESYTAALAFLGFRQVTAIDADEALVAGQSVLLTRFGATIAPI